MMSISIRAADSCANGIMDNGSYCILVAASIESVLKTLPTSINPVLFPNKVWLSASTLCLIWTKHGAHAIWQNNQIL
jgi:hypothetical protein